MRRKLEFSWLWMATLGATPLALPACGALAIGYEAELGDIDNLVAPSGDSIAATRESVGEEIEPETTVERTMSAEEAAQGVEDVQVLLGPPPRSEPSAPNPLGASDEAYQQAAAGGGGRPTATEPSGDPVLIDALVGQINGRPVFASEFFESMDARLRAEARRLSPDAWLRQARSEIQRELRGRIIDELLLAEFEASIPTEQREGLLTFVRQIRQQLVTENRGSAALAERRFREQGSSLDEEVRRIRDRQFINQQLRQEVASRIYVSWREVQAEFERNREKWDPPGTARLRMIWVDAGDAERLAEVERRIEGGDAFEDVARELSDFKRAEGGLVEVTLDAEEYADSTIFGAPQLNEAARRLSPGERLGPIDWNNRAVWLSLEEVDDPDPTLFELQLEIYGDLWNERFLEENSKYLESLINRGTMTDIETMERRLFQIAADRYLIAGRAAVDE